MVKYKKNAGQIVKGFLEENGIDLQLFNYQHQGKDTFRRKKRKIQGTGISIPTDVTNADVKRDPVKSIARAPTLLVI